MQLKIRPEQPTDYFESEALTREAFWNADVPKNPGLSAPGMPNCDEHLLLHLLRQSEDFIPELCMVAEDETGRLVGHIAYSRAYIQSPAGQKTPVLTFGPLSVLPACQGRGVGNALVRHTLNMARAMGEKAVVIFGHPGYYARFGFENARKFGITTAEGANFDAFMALPLYPGALQGVAGRYLQSAAFEMDLAQLPAFDARFPQKEK